MQENELLFRFIDGTLKDISNFDYNIIDSIWNRTVLLRAIGEYSKAINLLKPHIDKPIFRALYGETLLFTENFEDGISILRNIEETTNLPISLKLSIVLSYLKKVNGIQTEASLKFLKKSFLSEEEIKLNILFLALHNNLTGGAKVFFEYANRLFALGHNVCIAAKVLPPNWYKINVPWIIYNEKIPKFKVTLPDILFSMFWTLTPTSLAINIPVKILLEQGDPTIYEPDKFPKNQIQFMDKCYLSPIKIFVVSKNLKQLLKRRYGREAFYVPNGIDISLFKPALSKNNDIPIIMLVGADEIYFKGLKEVFEALNILKNRGHRFKVIQVTPSGRVIYNFEREVITKPSQEELAHLYAISDIFVTGSYFETFHLPPIEAMASGTAVVTTDNGGVEYCVNGVNSIIVPPKDPIAMAEAIEKLLLDKNLRNKIAEEGLKTARNYSWDKIIKLVEDELYNEVTETNIVTSREPEFKGLIELKDRNYLLLDVKIGNLRDVIKKYIALFSKEDSVNLIIANSPNINVKEIQEIIESLKVSPEEVPDIILLEEPLSDLDIWSIKHYIEQQLF
ncbi:MAG: glycosyltransferase family 4 protein [bacterium]|nr:glycosyltransferase family 4 protein [bacterium]